MLLAQLFSSRLPLFVAVLSFSSSAFALPSQDIRPVNNRDYFPAAMNLIGKASKDIRIILYLAQRHAKYPDSPVNQLLEALALARKRGVDVQVLLENPEDRFASSRDLDKKNSAVARFLSQKGVKVWEDSPSVTTHAKVLVVDGRYTVIGSTNWTFAALAKNNEAAVIIDSPEVARVYREMFDQIRAQGRETKP